MHQNTKYGAAEDKDVYAGLYVRSYVRVRPLHSFFRRQERLADPSASGEKLDSFLTGVRMI
jgi:hypothetical protein